jgi:hypothetical protein
MTSKLADFKVPTIRLAHAEQLVVDSFDIKADGTVHLEFRDYQLTPGGEVRADAFSRRDLQELIADPSAQLKTVVGEAS